MRVFKLLLLCQTENPSGHVCITTSDGSYSSYGAMRVTVFNRKHRGPVYHFFRFFPPVRIVSYLFYRCGVHICFPIQNLPTQLKCFWKLVQSTQDQPWKAVALYCSFCLSNLASGSLITWTLLAWSVTSSFYYRLKIYNKKGDIPPHLLNFYVFFFF